MTRSRATPPTWSLHTLPCLLSSPSPLSEAEHGLHCSSRRLRRLCTTQVKPEVLVSPSGTPWPSAPHTSPSPAPLTAPRAPRGSSRRPVGARRTRPGAPAPRPSCPGAGGAGAGPRLPVTGAGAAEGSGGPAGGRGPSASQAPGRSSQCGGGAAGAPAKGG